MPDALRDRATALMAYGAAASTAAAFLWLLTDVVVGGASRLSFEFLTSAPSDAGRAGGIGPIVVSTLLILLVCLAVAVPIGLGAAAYLSELGRRRRGLDRVLRRSLDFLASMPSIVFGLFGNVLFCDVLGLGFSILSGGLTLACMVLPILIRSAEDGFRAVPASYETGAAALGLSKWSTVRHIVFPLAAPRVAVGVVLGIGRAIAETAALIFTSGYVDRMPTSFFDSGRSLSIHIYDLSMNVPGGDANAYGAACVLVLMLVVINGVVGLLSRSWHPSGVAQ